VGKIRTQTPLAGILWRDLRNNDRSIDAEQRDVTNSFTGEGMKRLDIYTKQSVLLGSRDETTANRRGEYSKPGCRGTRFVRPYSTGRFLMASSPSIPMN
jgi:hypothetical protein